jgi:HSP20 family protein
MSNLFTIMDSLFDDVRPTIYRGASAIAMPALNVMEYKDFYEISVTIAGIDPKEVKVELNDKILNISYDSQTNNTENSTEVQTDKPVLLREEYRHLSFTRSVSLPKNVNQESITAKSKNGILTINIKKSPETQPKQIVIEHQ